MWSEEEKENLDAWLRSGGGMLIYSDSAAGGWFKLIDVKNPVGQTVVNNLIARYGMQVTVDNTGGTRSYTSANHSDLLDGLVLEGEGVSPVAVDNRGRAEVLIPFGDRYMVEGKPMDKPHTTDGVTIPEKHREWASLARCAVGDGNLIVLFDRQPLWNDGPGSHIERKDNKEILRRLIHLLIQPPKRTKD